MTEPDDYVPGSGDLTFDVSRYRLDLRYRVSSNRLTGRATITATTLVAVDVLSLDLAGMAVLKVRADGARVKRFTHSHRKLKIWFTRTLAVGAQVTLEVNYGGNPKPLRGPWGEIGWEELRDGVIVASQPNGAATWFPCNDRPSNKASYQISVTTDSPYRVVSNGVMRARQIAAGQTTWQYEQSEPMATYLVSVQIGRYDLIELAAESVPQLVAVPAGAHQRVKTELRRQDEMMEIFVRLFGPYPYAAYTVVVTEDALEIPLEAQGMSIFGSNYLDGSGSNERLVAHELAHQWFGNSVTVNAWRDIWLNEGFACYAEWLFSEFSGGASAMELAMTHHKRLARLPQDLPIVDPGPELMFDDRLYKRGALTLHQLRMMLGDEGFFDMLRAWTSQYRHLSVTTADFIAHAQRWSNASLTGFFDAWLSRLELPSLAS